MMHDAKQLLDLAKDWMKQGNTTIAFQLLDEANRLPDSGNDMVITGEIAKEMGRVFMQSGQWERAEDAYNRAVSIFLDHECFKEAAESFRNLANMRFQQGQFSDSYSLCEKAVELATNSGDFQLRATIFNTQAAIKSIEGKYLESIRVFNLCLSDFRRVGNRLRQAYVQHNIGLAQLELGEFQHSKISLEEALAMALENGDTNLVEMCYQNMARLHLKLGDIVTARSLIRAAGDILKGLDSPNLMADLAMIEAETFRLSGDLEKADGILNTVLELARVNKLLQHEAEILYEAGQLAIEQGLINIARSRLEAAITLFKKTGGAKLKLAVEKLNNLRLQAKKQIKA